MTDYTNFLGRTHPATTRVPEATAPSRPHRLFPAATGLKVVDSVAPVARGGSVEFAGPVGTGQLVLLLELAYRLTRGQTETAVVTAGIKAELPGAFPSFSGLIDDVDEHGRHAVFVADGVADANHALTAATSLAHGLAGEGTDVLLALDLATVRNTDVDPVLLTGVTPSGGSVTVVVFNVVGRAEALPDAINCDTRLVFSLERLVLGMFPAIDPILSAARFAEPPVAPAVRRVLEQAEEIRAFFHQPLKVAESFTGEPSTWVDPHDAEAELQDLVAR